MRNRRRELVRCKPSASIEHNKTAVIRLELRTVANGHKVYAQTQQSAVHVADITTVQKQASTGAHRRSSLSGSRADVLSSRMTTEGFIKKQRAKATRCCSPRDNTTPQSWFIVTLARNDFNSELSGETTCTASKFECSRERLLRPAIANTCKAKLLEIMSKLQIKKKRR